MGYKPKTKRKTHVNQNKNFRRYKGARKNGPPSPFGIQEEMLIEQYHGKINDQALLDLLILTFKKSFKIYQLRMYLKSRGFIQHKNRTKLPTVEIPMLDREAILAQIPESVKKQYDKLYEGENDVPKT